MSLQPARLKQSEPTVSIRQLTSSPGSSGPTPAGVPVETLQPLNETQIIQFIDNWYGGLIDRGQFDRGEALSKAEALKGAVQRPSLRELAQNPMLLTIMALVQTFRGTLPDERARLYQA